MGYSVDNKFTDWFEYVFEPERFVVYAMYDVCGVRLYIGRTSIHNLKHRMRVHYNNHEWVRNEVDRIEIMSEHTSWGACCAAEYEAIQLYSTEYNSKGIDIDE